MVDAARCPTYATVPARAGLRRGAVAACLWPQRRGLALLLVLQVVQALASLLLPHLSANVIDLGVVPGDTAYVYRMGGLMFVVSLVQVVFAVGATVLGARLAMRFGRDLRAQVFAHVQGFSLQEMNRFGAPSLITRSTNDVLQLQTALLMILTMVISAPLMAVGGVVMAVRQDAQLSLLLAFSIPVMVLAVAVLMSRTVPDFRKMQGQIDRLNQILREQITGMRVIRAFVRDTAERQRFASANATLTDTALHTGRLMAALIPMAVLVMQWSTIALVWFAAARIGAGSLPVGSLVAFLAYFAQILMSVMMAALLFAFLPRAVVCARRIDEVLGTLPSVAEPLHAAALPPGPAAAQPGKGPTGRGLVFAAVGFRYPGAAALALQDINLRIEPGQTVAVIGATGAGKSTLLNLIPRLFDVTAGQVRLDGRDVRDWSLPVLWGAIGLVPQKPYLFTGTIASNLRFGRADARDAELWRALDVAQAADFVRALPQGLATPVAQGGGNFSGGQRQRLTIARALVVKPRLFLFDDSTSALDYATEASLRLAMQPLLKDTALLLVGQRVSSLRQADAIVVLDAGAVVGTGTHAALLRQCAVYRAIVDSQLAGAARV
ncbi:MAG: ABC transporter ATP-binding protein [Aquabacterium sp.]|nr:ABC transporter ATP-binding protein [Aquabacterium sp.]